MVVERDFVGVEVDKVLARNHAHIEGNGIHVGVGLRRHDRVTVRRLRRLDADARAAGMSRSRCRAGLNRGEAQRKAEQDGELEQRAALQHSGSLRRLRIGRFYHRAMPSLEASKLSALTCDLRDC